MSTFVSPILLQCRQLSCERDGRVLFSGLDLQLAAGDIVQVEGPNGAGKTTLLRAITGLFGSYDGEINWCGEPISRAAAAYRANLLFIGHLSGIKKTLTPRENLAFLLGLQGAVDGDAIDSALAKVGLYGYEEVPGYQLSAGQLRRVALARLYLSQAPLWVLDEPYTAIDKQGVAHLEQRFSEHAASGGSVILTSHQAPQIDGLRRINLLDYARHYSASDGEAEFSSDEGAASDV